MDVCKAKVMPYIRPYTYIHTHIYIRIANLESIHPW